jgi:hypothetical protein
MKFKILNKKGEERKEKNQFTESSGLKHLAPRPGYWCFDRGFLSVLVPSESWYAGLCGRALGFVTKRGCCICLLDSLGGLSFWGF